MEDKKTSSHIYTGSDPLSRFRRALLYTVGFTKEQMDKPLIAVANTWNEIHPGHMHLRRLAEKVKEGVLMAGGMPMEFNTISLCDGLANGHAGMRYVLPSREIIADSIELNIHAHAFDAMVLIGSCDKIIPGLLMAAARIDIPAILVAGGPMFPGHWPRFDLNFSVSAMPEVAGRWGRGEFSEEQLEEMTRCIYPCAGACWGMGTANTMACLTEAVGLSLPGDGTAHATTAKKDRLAVEAGVRVMELLKAGLTPSKILTEAAFENMLRVNMAIGGSLNTVLHIPAIAHEAGIHIDMDMFDEMSRRTPHLCNIEPSGPYFLSDLERAGGIPGVMKRLEASLQKGAVTVTGKTVGENLQHAEVFDDEVIRPLDRPVHHYGGIAVLKGTLAPRGAVIKQVAVSESLWKFEGPAHVFDSEEDATQALLSGGISAGDVIIIRYEGPRGGPGMREMAHFRVMLELSGLGEKVYLITDGRYSGYSNGPSIGYLSPEAADGGPIALVRTGDRISIDVEARRLDVLVSEEEMAERTKQWKSPAQRVRKGYLARYAASARSAAEGAIIPNP
ncbi:MAG: dihydroxy-acid dehydratase [Candidatus Abyssobacteria bacterium SURF_5]|uniref:Dihydroxy-acid dehydratase n=1 Tax=Abyssobacteria bacterium (strain SURF_5) TaxID=2093360 RepID=A0A3A4P1X5_ABYX5|nr:MAG: dihydroxy-acid dehydratase [Candidatus Abyssubacteria bacterium SURF_5]